MHLNSFKEHILVSSICDIRTEEDKIHKSIVFNLNKDNLYNVKRFYQMQAIIKFITQRTSCSLNLTDFLYLMARIRLNVYSC